MRMAPFCPFPLAHGLLADMRGDEFPTQLSAWSDRALEMPSGATHLGFVYGGRATVSCESGQFQLGPGMYFCVPGSATVSGAGGGIVVSRQDYRGFFQVGGPVEALGRLNYIDGCTDSLLVAPVMRGDPCLNLLYFPPGINQTAHTHPSMRVGIIASGSGKCITPEGEIALVPGRVFVIPAHALHRFATQSAPMRVIAYHPDSDFGPTHEDHPMINRTMVNGVSASDLPYLQTA